MPARFTVVDAHGVAVDLAELVSARAATLASAGEVGDDVLKVPLVQGALRLRAEQVAVCSEHQFLDSSHTDRNVETDTAEVAA